MKLVWLFIMLSLSFPSVALAKKYSLKCAGQEGPVTKTITKKGKTYYKTGYRYADCHIVWNQKGYDETPQGSR